MRDIIDLVSNIVLPRLLLYEVFLMIQKKNMRIADISIDIGHDKLIYVKKVGKISLRLSDIQEAPNARICASWSETVCIAEHSGQVRWRYVPCQSTDICSDELYDLVIVQEP